MRSRARSSNRRTAPPRARTVRALARGERPWHRIATASARISIADRAGRSTLADDAHLGLERNAVHTLDRVLHVADQLLELRGTRVAVVDDEIRVFFRDHGIADAITLESGRFDQSRGMIAGRILEHRAAAPLTRRLGLPAPLGERAHAAARLTRARLELQLGGQKPFLGACARSRVDRLDLAIADVEVLRRARAPLAVAVDGLDTQHMAPGFIAECAGVHGQRAAKSARNAPEEFRLRQSPVHAGARNARARHAGLAVNPAL